MSYLVSYATSSEADFETMQWIFVMEPGFRVFAGRCAIMPAEQFDRLLAQRDELLAALQLAECVYRKNVVVPGEPSSVLDAMQAAIASATKEQA